MEQRRTSFCIGGLVVRIFLDVIGASGVVEIG